MDDKVLKLLYTRFNSSKHCKVGCNFLKYSKRTCSKYAWKYIFSVDRSEKFRWKSVYLVPLSLFRRARATFRDNIEKRGSWYRATFEGLSYSSFFFLSLFFFCSHIGWTCGSEIFKALSRYPRRVSKWKGNKGKSRMIDAPATGFVPFRVTLWNVAARTEA